MGDLAGAGMGGTPAGMGGMGGAPACNDLAAALQIARQQAATPQGQGAWQGRDPVWSGQY